MCAEKTHFKKSNTHNWKTVITLFIISPVIIFGIFLGLSAVNDKLSYRSSAATYSNKKKNIVLQKKKLVKLKKINVIPTRSPTISDLDRAIIKDKINQISYQNQSIGRILTPETFSEEEEKNYYKAASYWGNVGTATLGHNQQTGKIWGDDWWKPLAHQDMIFNLPPANYGDNTRSVANWWKVVEHFNLVGLVAPNSDTTKIYLAQAGTTSGIVPFEQKNFPSACYTDPLFMVNIADYGDE